MHTGNDLIDPTNSRDVAIPPPSPDADDAVEHISAMLDKLYPRLNDKERHLAEANLIRYCEIALAVAESSKRPKCRLTHSQALSTIKERSNNHLKV